MGIIVLSFLVLNFLYVGHTYKMAEKPPNPKYKNAVYILSILVLIGSLPLLAFLIPIISVFPFLLVFSAFSLLPVLISILVLTGKVEKNETLRKVIITCNWLYLAMLTFLYLSVGFLFVRVSTPILKDLDMLKKSLKNNKKFNLLSFGKTKNEK